MRYIKKYESYNKLDEILDIFIDLEEEGYIVKSFESKIVEDRDDWNGNFMGTKLRHVYGKKFINYHKDVIMSKGEKTYSAKDAIVVRISKINYIKDLTDRKIIAHWKKLDSEISKKTDVIKNRSEFLNLSLYGVMAEWYQLGKAVHDDFRDEPFWI